MIAAWSEGVIGACGQCGAAAVLQAAPGTYDDPSARVCRPCWYGVLFADARCPLKMGDRVQLGRPRRIAWRVRGVTADGRYAVCTIPFNPQRTVLYTILDFHLKIRGPDNLVGGGGYETDADITRALRDLESGDREVSRRTWRHVPLDLLDGAVAL